MTQDWLAQRDARTGFEQGTILEMSLASEFGHSIAELGRVCYGNPGRKHATPSHSGVRRSCL